MRLTVKEGFGHDTYKDTLRIHSSHRSGIRSGHLAKIWVTGGKSAIVAVRGLDDDEQDVIRLDLETRRRLAVKVNETHDFGLRETRFWEAVVWAAKASDPAARVAAWIGIWLGSIGILLSLAQLYQGWK
jgi:hypothetical protein